MNKEVKTDTMMKLLHFHDFYVIQAIDAALIQAKAIDPELQFAKKVEKFEDALESLKESLIPNMALRTFVYLYCACIGEARHARDNVAKKRFIRNIKNTSRSSAFLTATKFAPTQSNLKALVDIFNQQWRGGYGGDAWKNIAVALTDYGKMPDAAWLDHVVDLEHNNGTAFSKPDGRDTIMFDVNYLGRFSAFLDYKFEKDILTQEYYYDLAVSPRVHAMIVRYANVFGKAVPTHFVPQLQNLGEYTVTWGDDVLQAEEKWREWFVVEKTNKPDAKWALSRAGLFDITYKYLTADKLKEKFAEVKTKAVAAMGKHATLWQKAKIAKIVSKAMAEGLQECKLNKAPVTYSLLPTKVKVDGSKLVLSFALPYQKGYGEKTEYGFEIVTPNNSVYWGLATRDLGYDGSMGWHDAYVYQDGPSAILNVDKNAVYVSNNKLEALLD